MASALNLARIRAIRDKWGPLFQFVLGLCIMLVIFVAGMCMFMFVEGWNAIDSFYMMVITLSTVGFGEIQPLSDRARLLTSAIIILGVGNFAYIVGSFSRMLVDGHLHNLLWRRKVQRRIDKLENHYIVCGYGRIGGVVVQEILKVSSDVVVIEHDPALVEQLKRDGIMHLAGDATDDGLLVCAGIKRARSIVTALTDEAANVYVTLTARQLNPNISIIARANNASHITRLEFAGANRVVLPHLIGGVRMAHTVLKPTVTDFLDLAVRGDIDLQMEQLGISEKSVFVGKNIMDSNIRKDYDLIIVAIKRESGELVFNPGPREELRSGDTLITLGRQIDLQRISEHL
ncbi:MAG TPA: NAD-binding protein [Humidesulfovibrio sp.]|uniref:potassium channel family protein n=1 Tax=Humidesulfovibrio sp. TaxID=2910988 RepID=UPI002BFFCAE2|nr:NAD-binding protein [Humidesulfovibrio sp.]HWR03339.1 NAD-binding protein [Humidesulfovibrio sp.]